MVPELVSRFHVRFYHLGPERQDDATAAALAIAW